MVCVETRAHTGPFLFQASRGFTVGFDVSGALSNTCGHAFGWLQHSKDRKTLDVVLSAGTDNLANEALSVKRSTTRWPLMAVNMQLSSSLARARLTLALKWRPREENVEADQLTNEVYTGFDQGSQVEIALGDLDLSILDLLVATRAEFDEARNAAKEAARKLPSQNRKKVDKSPW